MGTLVKKGFEKEKLFFPMADLLSALAHPVRLKILSLLQQEDHCVCEMVGELGLPQSLVSQHLTILRRNGLVKAKRLGNRIYYSLSDKRLGELLNIAKEIVAQRLKELSSLIGGE